MVKSLEIEVDKKAAKVKFIYRFWDGIDTPDRTTIESFTPGQVEHLAGRLLVMASECRALLDVQIIENVAALKTQRKRLESELQSVDRKLGVLNDKTKRSRIGG